MSNTHIGFIGLGRMGRPMAGHLQTKGHPVAAYDIAADAVATLVKLGAHACQSPAEVARQAQLIFTVLPTHVEVEQVLFGADGVVANAAPGTLMVDMSTVDPAATDAIAKRLADAGMRFADAPIGRLASHADRGECLFMVGAEQADFDTIEPLLNAMGTTIHHCGAVGSGIRTKLVNNFLAITSCQMNAEALALAQRFGLDVVKTLEVIHGTTATNGQFKLNYATKVLRGDIEPGFQIDLAHKDLSLVLTAANAERVPMPTGAAAREALSLARASGYGAKDFSGLLDAACETAGVGKVRLPPGSN